ncbi:hypothetical protein BDR03DRAFT_987136 [Suillus americanus]|nr:hypothetical protein BDR03DRAFT_987136 [Suillus americanus]
MCSLMLIVIYGGCGYHDPCFKTSYYHLAGHLLIFAMIHLLPFTPLPSFILALVWLHLTYILHPYPPKPHAEAQGIEYGRFYHQGNMHCAACWAHYLQSCKITAPLEVLTLRANLGKLGESLRTPELSAATQQVRAEAALYTNNYVNNVGDSFADLSDTIGAAVAMDGNVADSDDSMEEDEGSEMHPQVAGHDQHALPHAQWCHAFYIAGSDAITCQGILAVEAESLFTIRSSTNYFF